MKNKKSVDIWVKYLLPVMPEDWKLEKTDVGDWIDLHIRDNVDMKQGEFQLIRLGIAVLLPRGYEAIIAPRSSTFKKYGIIQTNSIGVIDEAYCGEDDEWMFPAYATRDVKIPAGTRICQFRLIKHQPDVHFMEARFLSHISRGGFGSTGD